MKLKPLADRVIVKPTEVKKDQERHLPPDGAKTITRSARGLSFIFPVPRWVGDAHRLIYLPDVFFLPLGDTRPGPAKGNGRYRYFLSFRTIVEPPLQ